MVTCDIWHYTFIKNSRETVFNDNWYRLKFNTSVSSSMALLFSRKIYLFFSWNNRNFHNALSQKDLFWGFEFWGVFLSHSRIFHSYGHVTIAGEGLQILTYAWHSWPLSCEGSLACHTCCDTRHPLIMIISKDSWHSHRLAVELSLPGNRTLNLQHARRTL